MFLEKKSVTHENLASYTIFFQKIVIDQLHTQLSISRFDSYFPAGRGRVAEKSLLSGATKPRGVNEPYSSEPTEARLELQLPFELNI
jgi:hypothetical protein